MLSSPERVSQSPRTDGSNDFTSSPPYPDSKIVPTIRKDQFCFKRIRDPSGQAPDHDWYARRPTVTTRENSAMDITSKSSCLSKARPAADLLSLHPASTECASSSQCQISKGSSRHPAPPSNLIPGRKSPQHPLRALFVKERNRSKSHRKEQDNAKGPASWWSQTGSNRRPHACKARALPAELWPRNQKTNAHKIRWWAWEDLNFRPHAYQARALTN